MDDQKIIIHPEIDTCTICCKSYKHRVRFTNGVIGQWKETELITAHATCRHLITQKQELERKMLDVEFKLFLLKTDQVIYLGETS